MPIPCLFSAAEFPRRFLRLTAAWIVLASTVAFAQNPVPQAATPSGVPTPSFDVATIKPHPQGGHNTAVGLGNRADGVDGTFVTLAALVAYAYHLRTEDQVMGIPAWAKDMHFDIQAKMSEADTVALGQLSSEDRQKRRRQMMLALLAERFHLVAHPETKQVPIYELQVVKNGSKLKPASPDSPYTVRDKEGKPFHGYLSILGTSMTAQAYSMHSLADFLSQRISGIGRPVVDKTGLAGEYDFMIHWSPSLATMSASMSGDGGPPPAEDAANIFSALDEIGLKLQPSTGPIETIVIDHAERPTAN